MGSKKSKLRVLDRVTFPDTIPECRDVASMGRSCRARGGVYPACMDDPIADWPSGRRVWDWRSTTNWLARLPDRDEPLTHLFRRMRYASQSLDVDRNALAHISHLIQTGDLDCELSVGETVAALKRRHREAVKESHHP